MVADDRCGGPGGGAFALSVSRPRPHVVVVRVAGPLDLATISTVRGTAARHLDGAHVVLDLGPVTFLSASTAQLLLDLDDHAAGCDTVLHTATPADEHARQVLDLTGVALSTPLHATVAAALHHLDGAAGHGTGHAGGAADQADDADDADEHRQDNADGDGASSSDPRR